MKFIILAILFASSLALPKQPNPTIFGVADSLGATALTKLVEEADVAPQLAGSGPFTLFAPTNEAFLGLPEGVLQELQKDHDLLAKVLKYHVAPGTFHTSCAVDEELLRSMQGTYVRINTYGANRTYVSGSRILTADKDASNGVVHLIDKVLYPLPNGTVVDVVLKNPLFSTFYKYLRESAHTVHYMREMGAFTVFSPTDDAFSKLPKEVLDKLSQDKKFLRSVLEYHIVPRTYYDESLFNAENLTTISGQKLEVKKSGSIGLFVGTARVIRVDLVATNGVVYGLDEVMIPPNDYTFKANGLGRVHDPQIIRDAQPVLRDVLKKKEQNAL